MGVHHLANMHNKGPEIPLHYGGHIVAAILDFMETCNTKNVHMYVIDQPVKFRGNIPQFKFLPYSLLRPLKLKAAILDFVVQIDRVVPIGCDPTGS